MIQKARIQLTLLYSAIFLLLFWMLSFGIYAWMNQFFGDHGRIQVIQTIQREPDTLPFLRREPSNDIVMDNLRNILIFLDTSLLVIIPIITWLLTGKTLQPVQKAHQRERQFLTDASHELRTPLSILRAQMEVTLKKKRPVQEYQKIITSNMEEVDDLIGLVESLLFLSRERTNYSNPINEQIDIADLLAERVALFQTKAKQKGLLLTLHPPKTNLVIYGNQQLLKRLFANLLDNAIKYTSQGNVEVTVKQMKNMVHIAISDTGIGIPEEQQEKIFDRFYRSDISRSEPGFGLGLSIAKQIMDVHHGTITAKSSGKKGTTMLLVFPVENSETI